MSDLKTQKRIAAQVLGIGQTRVWVNPEAATDIAQAMTREDVRELIKQGLIQEMPKKVQTRARAKKRVILRRKRKGVGHGKRSGTAAGRRSKKEKWMGKVRPQRNFIRNLRDRKKIDAKTYRKYYLRIKGNSYASVNQMKEAMKTDGALK
jgi:large subunit ribosomal protein L19e